MAGRKLLKCAERQSAWRSLQHSSSCTSAPLNHCQGTAYPTFFLFLFFLLCKLSRANSILWNWSLINIARTLGWVIYLHERIAEGLVLPPADSTIFSTYIFRQIRTHLNRAAILTKRHSSCPNICQLFHSDRHYFGDSTADHPDLVPSAIRYKETFFVDALYVLAKCTIRKHWGIFAVFAQSFIY